MSCWTVCTHAFAARASRLEPVEFLGELLTGKAWSVGDCFCWDVSGKTPDHVSVFGILGKVSKLVGIVSVIVKLFITIGIADAVGGCVSQSKVACGLPFNEDYDVRLYMSARTCTSVVCPMRLPH
jgi:hypothetical protein